MVSSSADAVLIDYARLDVGASGQRVEGSQTADPLDDWTAVGTIANNASGNFTTGAFTSITADSFTLAIENVNTAGATAGAIDWRDRGDSTSTEALTRLGEDFLKNNAGIIRITFGSLPAGVYQLTSYHIDPDNVQTNRIGVFVTDADGTAVQRADTGDASFNIPGANTAEQVNNLTTAIMEGSTAVFSVRSDGVSDVVVVFDGTQSTQTPADIEAPFNGIRIQADVPIPEPTGLSLVGLAALGLLARRRRR